MLNPKELSTVNAGKTQQILLPFSFSACREVRDRVFRIRCDLGRGPGVLWRAGGRLGPVLH